MGERVRIIDVAPRDGLQNESGFVPTAEKARLVNACALSGVDEVEATSFVSPKWIPQLGDAAELCNLIAGSKPEGVVYSALVPNEKGMARLLEVNDASCRAHGRRVIDKVSVFTAASETFSRKNTNASIAETIERFQPVRRLAREQELSFLVYVSCVIACPYEGATSPEHVQAVLRLLDVLEPDEVDLGDTIGAGRPDTVTAMIEAARSADAWTDNLPDDAWVLHLHDTHAKAGACVVAALAAGIRRFDGSVAGLGGCPYASTETTRAPGNIDTALLVRTVEEAGYDTAVDHDRLAVAAGVAGELVAPARDLP